MTTLAENFTDIFRTEHRSVRDLIMELIQAFKAREQDKTRIRLEDLAALTGPHFRYEEESLYPQLTTFFTDEYVAKLYSDHSMAIGNAKKLITLANKSVLTDEDIIIAVRTLQSIMPHVSDCDGLSILIETLPNEDIQKVLNSRDIARSKNLDLIQWADSEHQVYN